MATRPAAEWGAEYARFLKSRRHGPPQRDRAAAAPRGDRAPDRAARRRGQGHRKRHPLSDGHAAPVRRRRRGVGLVAPGVRLRAGRHRPPPGGGSLSHAVQRGRHPGQQLHVLGRRRARRHPSERRAVTARDSSRSDAPPRAGSRSTARVRSRPVFSAEFDLPPQRAAVLALAELRLPPDTQAAHARTGSSQAGRQSGGKRSLPQRTTVRDGARRGLSPAGAVRERAAAGASPLQFPRDSHSDPGAAGLLLSLAGGMFAWSRYADRKYLARHQRRDRPSRAGRRARHGARPSDRQGARADATARPLPRADRASTSTP